MKTNKKILYFSVAIFPLAAFLLFSYFIGCPIRLITGIPCPACGLTRAFLSLLKGDVAGALYYHPLFYLLPLVIADVFLLIYAEKKKPNNKLRLPLIIISAVLLILFLCVYVLRLIKGNIP